MGQQVKELSYSAVFTTAKEALAKGDWDAVQKAADEALAIAPERKEAVGIKQLARYRQLRAQGDEALKQGKKAEAFALLKQALEQNESSNLGPIIARLHAEIEGSKLLAQQIPEIEARPPGLPRRRPGEPGEWRWSHETLAKLQPVAGEIWSDIRNPSKAGITQSHTRAALLLALALLEDKDARVELLRLLDARGEEAPAVAGLEGEPEGAYAAAALARLGRESLTPLAERIKAAKSPQAEWCAFALAYLGPDAVETLLAGAQSEDPSLSAVCIDSLREVGAPAAGALTRLIDDKRSNARASERSLPASGGRASQSSIRDKARAALISLGPSAADGVLAVADGLSRTGIEAAADVLVQLGPGAVPSMVAAHARGPGRAQLIADTALGHIGAEAVPGLLAGISSDDKATHDAALDLTRTTGERLTPRLIEEAKGNEPAPDNIVQALNALGPRASVGLAAAFRSDDADLNNTAEMLLVQMGANALGPLADLIASPQSTLEVKLRALDVLAVIGAPATPALLAAMESDAPVVAGEARQIIIGFGDGALAYLRPLLGDTSASVRYRTMLLLWEMKGAAAVPDVKGMLQDSLENIRLAAIQIIGRAGTEKDIETLVPLLHDASSAVRAAVVEVLLKQGGRNAARRSRRPERYSAKSGVGGAGSDGASPASSARHAPAGQVGAWYSVTGQV